MSDQTPPPPDGTTPPPYGTPPPPPPPPGGYAAAPPPPPGYGIPAPGGYGAPAPTGPYAQWPQRALAYIIDFAPVIGGYIVALILAAILPDALGALVMFLVVIGALGWVVYNYGIQQGTTGYTLGKGIVGIKLISEQTGQPVGTGLAVARYFVHIVDAIPCYIGFLWPLWDAKKQTFADKILTQTVIVAPKP